MLLFWIMASMTLGAVKPLGNAQHPDPAAIGIKLIKETVVLTALLGFRILADRRVTAYETSEEASSWCITEAMYCPLIDSSSPGHCGGQGDEINVSVNRAEKDMEHLSIRETRQGWRE